MQIKTHNPQQTQSFATEICRSLKGGDILALEGDLGSGKTTFTQGVLKALGVNSPVTSPTFIVMQIYKIENHPSIKEACHIDAYRLASDGDIISSGIEDYLGAPNVLCIIEWPERLSGHLPTKSQLIKFSHLDSDNRLIEYK